MTQLLNYFVVIVGASLAVLVTAPTQAQILTDETLTRGERGHYLIEVMINEQVSFTFLVDTGASNTFLMQSAVEDLGLDAAAWWCQTKTNWSQFARVSLV